MKRIAVAEWFTAKAVLALSLSVFATLGLAEDLYSVRASELGYPKLPAQVLNKIQGKNSPSTSNQMDPLLSQDWGLASIGFFDLFTPLVQVSKKGTESCSDSVVVAVVDTGIDYTHADLRENVWVNRGETGSWQPAAGAPYTLCRDKSCNGIDDDGNGFADDVIGWDFVNNIPFPYDTHGHGSHIAGIIAASAANGVGVSGVCPRVSIMALKYYDSSGGGLNNLQNTVKAIQYAVANGADIINYSGGGAEQAASERMAIQGAREKGILFVAAAGNDGHNNDFSPYYPASYGFDNIISVASINRQGKLLPSSNFGKTVHVGAPGLSIMSALPGGRFGTMSGTSQATAFVTGAAALLQSQFPKGGVDYLSVKEWIEKGVKPMSGNENRNILANGIISLPGSLKMAQDWNKAKKSAPSLALVPTNKSKSGIR